MASRLLKAAATVSLACNAFAQSSSNTATIDLSTTRGAPQHLAAGFIYGIPDAGFGQSPNQIPASFYQGMGFNYARAGGAQLSEGGWIMGMTAYKARFQSTLQNYHTARSVGARFQILPHDVWGTDHANSSTVWPGDNGNWTNYMQFLKRLTSDIIKHNMTVGLDWDLWNEPDGGVFWQRSETQYLQMWQRTYNYLRTLSAFNNVLIVGPSTAGSPSTSNSWWETYIQFVVQNKVIPQQWTWHQEPGDPGQTIPAFYTLAAQNNAPTNVININEYATYDQQNAAGAAWFISRLERYNAYGLRGNWLSGCQLHDFMASLLGKSNDNNCTAGGYYGNGEYQVYNYYTHNMTGVRATTTGSGDGVLDVYTTIGSGYVKILTGVLTNTGTWYITINNLQSVGLPSSGTLTIQTYGFEDAGHYGQEGYPSNRGTYGHPYTNGTVTFPVFQTSQDEYTAWVFQFAT